MATSSDLIESSWKIATSGRRAPPKPTPRPPWSRGQGGGPVMKLASPPHQHAFTVHSVCAGQPRKGRAGRARTPGTARDPDAGSVRAAHRGARAYCAAAGAVRLRPDGAAHAE